MVQYLIYAAILILGFILAFVPMWLRSRASQSTATEHADRARTEGSLAVALSERQLDLARTQNNLAAAAIDARRGDYEAARQAASGFFTSSRDEASRGTDSTLSQAQRQGLQPLLAQRDEIITLLARNDIASADRLSDLYVSFRELMST